MAIQKSKQFPTVTPVQSVLYVKVKIKIQEGQYDAFSPLGKKKKKSIFTEFRIINLRIKAYYSFP